MRRITSTLTAPAVSRRRVAIVATFAAFASAAGLGTSAQASASEPRKASPGFGWFEPSRAPAGWKHVRLLSGGAVLSYPASLGRIHSDAASVSFGTHDRSGRILVYLNVTPKQGNESLANWPAFRIRHNRGESDAVHEDGHAVGLWFIGGKGSCVIDHYETRVKVNSYREIACFVRGRTTASVIVATALRSRWARAATLLERAVESYRVN